MQKKAKEKVGEVTEGFKMQCQNPDLQERILWEKY